MKMKYYVCEYCGQKVPWCSTHRIEFKHIEMNSIVVCTDCYSLVCDKLKEEYNRFKTKEKAKNNACEVCGKPGDKCAYFFDGYPVLLCDECLEKWEIIREFELVESINEEY